MQSALALLVEFHDVFQRHAESLPTVNIPLEVKQERQMLLREETKELIEAIDSGTLDEVAKELCDVLYAAFGTAVAFGLTEKLPELFAEVHRSNMSKLDKNGQPLIRADGKILKSEQYTPADMETILQN